MPMNNPTHGKYAIITATGQQLFAQLESWAQGAAFARHLFQTDPTVVFVSLVEYRFGKPVASDYDDFNPCMERAS